MFKAMPRGGPQFLSPSFQPMVMSMDAAGIHSPLNGCQFSESQSFKKKHRMLNLNVAVRVSFFLFSHLDQKN